jgi:hypothetical protein
MNFNIFILAQAGFQSVMPEHAKERDEQPFAA